jgi:hypothetical protein
MLVSSIPRPRQPGLLPFAPQRLREVLFPWLRPRRDTDRRVPAPAVPTPASTDTVALRGTIVPASAAAKRMLTESDRGLLMYLIERALLPWMR